MRVCVCVCCERRCTHSTCTFFVLRSPPLPCKRTVRTSVSLVLLPLSLLFLLARLFFILLLFLLPCSHQHCVFLIAYSFLALCCHGSCTGRAKQPVKYSLTRIATVEVRSPPPHCSSLLAGSEPIDCRIA